MSSGETGILVAHDDVMVRNCRIRHSAGFGIRVVRGSCAIQNVEIEYIGRAWSGRNASPNFINIRVDGDDCTIENVRLIGGSAGIYCQDVARPTIRFAHGEDFRGPFPRGQFVQFNRCTEVLLEDFSARYDLKKSYSEDGINLFDTHEATIRRGVIDGNNSPSGMCYMAEAGSSTVTFDNLDAVNYSNGAFGFVATGRGCRMERIRHRDKHDNSASGRGVPLSASGASDGLGRGISIYWDPMSAPIVVTCVTGWRYGLNRWWDLTRVANRQRPVDSDPKMIAVDEDFTPRRMIDPEFPWS